MTVRRFVYWSPDRVGSIEHYWHFLIGYVLPLATLLSLDSPLGDRPRRGDGVVVQSCGPLMDPILHEVFGDAYQVSVTDLRSRWEQGVPAPGDEAWIQVPRLDAEPWWWDPTLPLAPQGLAQAEAAVNGFLGAFRPCGAAEHLLGRVILLERSPQPDFYAPGGPALVPTYGRGRRALTNVRQAAEQLTASGLPAATYEPGAHSIRCQASVFSRAAGVVGVRGAEFANLLWSTRGTPVVAVDSPGFAHPSPGIRLAEYRGLEWHTIQADDSMARIDPRHVLCLLRA